MRELVALWLEPQLLSTGRRLAKKGQASHALGKRFCPKRKRPIRRSPRGGSSPQGIGAGNQRSQTGSRRAWHTRRVRPLDRKVLRFSTRRGSGSWFPCSISIQLSKCVDGRTLSARSNTIATRCVIVGARYPAIEFTQLKKYVCQFN